MMVSSDLSWSEHVNVTVNKAKKLLALVHKTMSSSNLGEFFKLYKSLVRRVLEYAAPVWNPYLAKDALSIEIFPAKILPACSRAKTWKEAEVAYTQNREIVSFLSRVL